MPIDREKYKSIGHMKRGRTRHTDAGSIVVDVTERRGEDGKLVRDTLDHKNSTITEHQDGRQDVEIRPKTIGGKGKAGL